MGPGFESLKVHQRQVAAPNSLVCPKNFVFLSTDKEAGKRREICALVSVSNAEGPPVPIPNTEVKLCSAENTHLATSWEDRSTLTHSRLF